LTTLWSIIGKKQLVVFLATLALCALGAGFLINAMDLQLGIGKAACHSMAKAGGFEYLCTAALIGILAKGMLPIKQTTPAASGGR